MNSKWMIRATALCMALMLSAPAVGEEPPAPTGTASASETHVADLPGEDAGEIEVKSPQPEVTAEPEMTAEPEQTADLEMTAEPETTAEPDETPAPSDAPQTASPVPVEDESIQPGEGEEVLPPEDEKLPVQTAILSFGELMQSEWELAEKPTLEEAFKLFPDTLEAHLEDGEAVQVPVIWQCGSYDEVAERYAFSAALAEEGYVLADGVTLPVVTLRILPSSELVAGDFTYQIREDGALSLQSYAGKAASVSVPDQVEGHPVVAVAATAFAQSDTLESLTLPKGLLELEGGALKNCARLKTVELPDSLEKVGAGIFDGCAALEYLQLNISLETTVTDGKGFARKVVEENGEVRTVQVGLDRPFTDYCVLSGGTWIQEGEIRIERDHAATVSGDLKISASGVITVLGSLNCAGNVVNEGRIIACAGAVSGVNDGVAREHTWSDGVCTVCGAHQARMLIVTPKQESFERTYDGTYGVDIGPEDFTLEGVREGDEVTIAAVNQDFQEKDAGSYLTAVSFELGGANRGDYEVKPVEISVVIHPKEVTVTPRSGQSKVYGAKDPALRAGYRGTVSGETLSGALSREKGEDAGRYRIHAGTLERLNPNYRIVLAEETFEITAKSISAAGIALAKVPNQRYTGAAVEPDVELLDGAAALREGRDYTLSYENNENVGTATVTVTGKGNYTGSRKATFQIIKVSTGSGGGGIQTGSFGGADLTADDSTVASEMLTLDGEDWGAILFDETGLPRAFMQSSRQVRQEDTVHTVLCLSAEPRLDETEYGELRLHLSLSLIAGIRAAGYTDVELQVGAAQLRVPLDTLYAEYVGESGTLAVERYELRLWMMDGAEELSPDYRTVMTPVHCEVLAIPVDGNVAEEDVLSLLDGVLLRLVPEEEPDYQNTRYFVLRTEDADPGAIHEPEGAAFILDASRVKCSLTPVFGGTYALAVRADE